MAKNRSILIIPAAVSAAIILASLLGLFSSLDWGLYDRLLGLRTEPPEHDKIVLADFDDPAINQIGSWPVGRDITAEGLATMAELGAEVAVFDIEYVNASPRGFNARYLEETLPTYFDEKLGDFGENIQGLYAAIAEGMIPLEEAGGYFADLAGRADANKDELYQLVRQVAVDNDLRLGRAASFFGKAYFTVNMHTTLSAGNEEAKKLALERAGAAFPETGTKLLPIAVDIDPTIPPILERSAGAGFPNVFIDVADGVRRRIDVFYEYEGKRFGQLIVAPLLELLGSPEVSISRNHFIFKSALLPSGEVVDIKIPRAEDGRMLINWPHDRRYEDSFRHVSFKKFLDYQAAYSNLVHNIRIRDFWGYFDGYEGDIRLIDLAKEADDFRIACLEGEGEMPADAADKLRTLRGRLIDEVQRFLATSPDLTILNELDAALASPKLEADRRATYETIRSDLPSYFENTRAIMADLVALRTRLMKDLDGAICIIGFTATGTTDIGINPFASEYVNVGTHAAVANTVLQRSFLDDAPAWISLAIAVATIFGLSLLIAERKPLHEILIGLAVTVVIAGALVAVFIATGIFVAPVAPILGSFLTFLTSTIVSFLRTEREKGFLRNAFSHYLSAEVIKEIVSDPSKLKLGGTKKTMTAVFTDIRGFSTVSEKLSPEDLVRLLNQYLSGMSDVILDLKGTIDKYEGDAIIAFFGAPIDLPDHAERACRAAIKMKHIEQELNNRFLSEGISPTPLLTRLGINTGDMVVGNMGTERKMDYTIIGDAVNLAARLEGVNKQYGTWICVSEDTVSAAGGGFLFRQLDRIRVVGKSQPIRIFELAEERSALKQADIEFYGLFERGLELFEHRDWNGALATLTEALRLRPEDGPSKTFMGRSEAYKKTPPAADWDGVYNLTMK